MDLYASLNEMQAEAVRHERGPLLILAGAGSGKTRVITHRIARLICECGVSPYRILAITFTNKAADEMKERVAKLLDDEFNDVWVSTFHSMCVRMLRRFCPAIGYDQNFVIYDTDDQKRAMRDTLKHLNIDVKMLPPKQVLSVISSAKNELIGPEEFRTSKLGLSVDRNISRAYAEYQELLRKNNAFDFDDLLMKTVEMLKASSEALEYYQNRFQFIMVDEYQDTNTAQFELIHLLASHVNEFGETEHNLCVVGDDDQSIYRFRGANIMNILNFEKYYPDARVIKLEQNYRSTQRILETANTVVANNLGRKKKTLWTGNEEGDLIRLTEYPSDLDEASEVIRDIARSVRNGGSYRDYAILYRTNAQSRAFEEQCVYNGIPYRLVGGTNFYERKEIRDMLAYLRVVDNGSDSVSVKRVINVPKRGIGDTTMDRIDEYSYIKDIPLYEVLLTASDVPGIGTRTANNIRTFTDIIDTLRTGLATPGYSLPRIIDDILEATDYEADLRETDADSADDRLANISELKNKIAQYVQETDEPSLAGFLADVALVADIDSLDKDADGDYVVLMTLHSAKGLEFDHVYIGGLEDGLFPSGMSLDSDEGSANNIGLEEERRLFYVGITRARKTLSLSYCGQRMARGEMQFNRPSRFLSELPRENIRKVTFGGSTWSSRSASRGTGSSGQYQSRPNTRYASPSSFDELTDFGSSSRSGPSYRSSSAGDIHPQGAKPGAYRNPYAEHAAPKPAATSASALGFGVGDRVRHIKFGVGTVKTIVQGSHDFEVTVEFAAGTKVMLASFAKLVKVE